MFEPSYHEVTFHNGMYEFKGLSQNNDGKHVNSPPCEDVILCLHGWLDNAASFIPLLPYLTEHKVIAIDLIGHGYSPHRSVDAHYHFFDWVDDILRLINYQGWQRIHIVGHSMGGMIACALAAAFGEKIASITLLDVLGFICCDSENTTEQLYKGLISRKNNARKNVALYSSVQKAVVTRMHASGLTEESAHLIVERGITKTAKGYIWRVDPRLNNISPYRLTLLQAKQLLKDIKCPVQLLYSEDGYLSDGKVISTFKETYQNFQVIKFTGKHHFHMEQAEKTANFIKELVKRA